MYKYHGIFWDAKYIHFNSRRFWNWWFILVNLLRWSLHASLLADGPGQVALDIWFVSCCLIVRFCVFFSLFYMYVFACLFCLRFSCVFVMVESACQRARRWSWTGGSRYLVCLFVNVFLCVSFLVFMRWLVLACLCCWWNLRACLLADDFGQTVFLGSRGGISILDWMNDF